MKNNNSILTTVYEDVFFNGVMNISDVTQTLYSAPSFRLGGVSIANVSLDYAYYTNITITLRWTPECQNNGKNGSIYIETRMQSSMLIEVTGGAENTSSALRLISNDELSL